MKHIKRVSYGMHDTPPLLLIADFKLENYKEKLSIRKPNNALLPQICTQTQCKELKLFRGATASKIKDEENVQDTRIMVNLHVISHHDLQSIV